MSESDTDTDTDDITIEDIASGEVSDEEIREFNERKREELKQRGEHRERELEESAQLARDAILGIDSTTTVDLADLDEHTGESVELTVRTYIPEPLKKKMTNPPEEATMLDLHLDVFESQIVGPEGYNDRDAWRAVWAERGDGFLDACMDLVLTPVDRYRKAVKDFPDRQRDS